VTEGQYHSIKYESIHPHLVKDWAVRSCTIADVWSLPTVKPCGSILILILRNQSRKFETTVLKWLITKVENPNIDVYEHGDRAVCVWQTAIFW